MSLQKMKAFIEQSIRKHNRVAIKVIRRNQRPQVYSDHTLRIQKSFHELVNDIQKDLEACVCDFPEDRVLLSVTLEDGIEQVRLFPCYVEGEK